MPPDDRLRVVFCHRGGVPSEHDGSRRSLAALRWLAARHEVALLPVYLPLRPRPPDGEAAARLSAAGLGQLTLLPGADIPGDPSVLNGRPMTRLGRGLRPSILEQLDGADWLWVGCPPAVADAALISECRRRGIRISWDWDCLSLLGLRFGRALWPSARSLRAYGSAMASAVYERRFLRPLDALSVPGERDRVTLERISGRTVMRVRPTVPPAMFEAPSGSDDGPLALFVGSSWPPNVHGIAWVLRDVWPAVHARSPQARLRIVGHDIARALPGPLPPGVELGGSVPEVADELRRARVVICPIFFGAGIPTKLLEAAAAGRATLATTYCERVLGSWPFPVSDDAHHWVQTLVTWLGDPAHAADLGRRAREYAEREWGEARWSEDMAGVEATIRGAR